MRYCERQADRKRSLEDGLLSTYRWRVAPFFLGTVQPMRDAAGAYQ